jgi:hypothetical protein
VTASIVEAGLAQVLEGPVAVVGVGPRLVEHRRQGQPGEAAVRLVEDVDPDLLLDHRDLVRQVLLGDGRPAHPVGLEEEGPVQGVGREHLVVVGVVQAGRAVEDTARRRDLVDQLHLPEGGRALEHQVLEEVGEARPPLRLGADADVVVDGNRHHRR